MGDFLRQTNPVVSLNGADPSSLTSAHWLILLTAESSGAAVIFLAICKEQNSWLGNKSSAEGLSWKRGGLLRLSARLCLSGGRRPPAEGSCWSSTSWRLVLAERDCQLWSSFPVSKKCVITPTSPWFTYIILQPAAASCCSTGCRWKQIDFWETGEL